MSFEDKEYVCSDCWITARDAERERIIKLLEEHMPNSSDHDFVGCECEYPTNNWYNNHLIALIKGENK